MISIYQLKSRFQNLLSPCVTALAKAGVTANQVTILTCLASIAMGLFFFIAQPEPQFYFLLPPFLFFRMAMNAIDGMLARLHNMKTPLGAILNELTDVIADSFLYYPLILLWGVSAHWNVLFILLSALTEMTGVIGIQIGASRRYDGPFGKSDRAFIMGLLSLIFGFQKEFGHWIEILFIVLVGLLCLTIFKRASSALKEINPGAQTPPRN